MPEVAELPVSLYKSETKPDWCPGCGDYGVLNCLQKAVSKLGIYPKDLLIVSGIGCSSNLPGFIHTYGFHSLHGRAVPVATGAKLANPDLNVVITGGDGDAYGIGLGHFLHVARRNINLTYIVMDNQIYGLTTGQASPTSRKGHKTKSTPAGNIETPLNPLALAMISGATFVARGFSGDANHLSDIMAQAIAHKGFSLVDVFSPCVTYNKVNTYPWFRENIYKLEDVKHDRSDYEAALKRAHEWDTKKIPIGVFYQTIAPTYEEEDVTLKNVRPLKQKLGLTSQQAQEILKEFI
ncbi:MAG: 2-oxoacid:ferredoxin oxidoreductase subunit beta [Chlamydiae bacterium]|nr:2-oxoacid:ferredoxin oxidoreductase subunit beta [Chlamydiota bacterium]MBI3265429.1 2-oxoacid:ferredoxin oxidoreductase subunit beta [Chlamydiota bacterium]